MSSALSDVTLVGGVKIRVAMPPQFVAGAIAKRLHEGDPFVVLPVTAGQIFVSSGGVLVIEPVLAKTDPLEP